MKGTPTELNNAEIILQIIFSHFDFWIVSAGDFTTVSITIWTAGIQFLYAESEEHNYLVENGYDAEHSVTPMAKVYSIFLAIFCFSTTGQDERKISSLH